MIIVDSPTALPGSCFICGSANRNQYIDTEKTLDFHGAVYICVEQCAELIGKICEFLPPGEAEKIIKENLELENQVYTLSVRVSGLEKAVDGLTVYRDTGGNSLNSFSTMGDSKNESSVAETVTREPKSSQKNSRRSNKQIDEPQLGGVQSDDSGSKFELKL